MRLHNLYSYIYRFPNSEPIFCTKKIKKFSKPVFKTDKKSLLNSFLDEDNFPEKFSFEEKDTEFVLTREIEYKGTKIDEQLVFFKAAKNTEKVEN